MKSAILFRKDISTESELEIAKKYFTCVELRSQVPENSLVIGRYSVLPFYRELEKDLGTKNSKLINTYWQHAWIADFEYYEELKDYTFPSWRDNNFYTCHEPGPFVVKGATNSRKHRWNKLMYAETRERALEIAAELTADPLISNQGIVYRQYVPLRTFERCPISGLPITNEFRCFFYKEQLLASGYYWSIAQDPAQGELKPEGLELAQKVASIVFRFANFFVLDIAEKESGGWILVEINDGAMSGLSMVDPETLYANLAIAVEKETKYD